MIHPVRTRSVIEDIVASGWTPGPGFIPPPATPDRDVSRPA